MAVKATKTKTSGKTTKAPRGRPPLGSRHGFLGMGVCKRAANDWTVVLATNSLYFTIDEAIIRRAEPGNPERCVVALALKRVFGKQYDFQVGKVYTKIWDRNAKIEIRWHTPAALSKRIGKFDGKKGWDLPANIYKLHPMPKDVVNGWKNTLANISYHVNKKNKKKIAGKFSSKSSTKTSTIIKGGKLSAPTKKRQRAAYSRLVLRNSRIKWTPPQL